MLRRRSSYPRDREGKRKRDSIIRASSPSVLRQLSAAGADGENTIPGKASLAAATDDERPALMP